MAGSQEPTCPTTIRTIDIKVIAKSRRAKQLVYSVAYCFNRGRVGLKPKKQNNCENDNLAITDTVLCWLRGWGGCKRGSKLGNT